MLASLSFWSLPIPSTAYSKARPVKGNGKTRKVKKSRKSALPKTKKKKPKGKGKGKKFNASLKFTIPAPFRLLTQLLPLATTQGVSSTPVVSGKTAVQKVLATVRYIEKNLKTSHYQALTRIDVNQGKFNFDCSGMVGWILNGSAPQASAEVSKKTPSYQSRPIVANFVKTLQSIQSNKPTLGWRRVLRIADARPGDVIAWPTPSWYPSSASGHMGIVAEKPVKVQGGYLVRIADSTSYPHGNDTRNGGSGFGYGTIFVTVDPKTGEGTGQGWTGRYSTATVIRTPVVVGRPLN